MASISQKKPFFHVYDLLDNYLKKYDRHTELDLHYRDLLHWKESVPVLDKEKRDTLWISVLYDQIRYAELNQALTRIYAQLQTAGDAAVTEHLNVERIDYCTFGNSKPFRIRIVNQFNDNYDYFYIKQTDSSRIYGLELEHLLSPNNINYFVEENTLVEEHIIGIPGDVFITRHMNKTNVNRVRLAKEFVKFNERCFVRLLGDMRSYNYVVVVTHDFDEEQYRIRAIDFDQQSYEGEKELYIPRFFKDNSPVVDFCTDTMTPETIRQYRLEERTLIARRAKASAARLRALIQCMSEDCVSVPEKQQKLARALARHHGYDEFLRCNSMGEIVKLNIEALLNLEIY